MCVCMCCNLANVPVGWRKIVVCYSNKARGKKGSKLQSNVRVRCNVCSLERIGGRQHLHILMGIWLCSTEQGWTTMRKISAVWSILHPDQWNKDDFPSERLLMRPSEAEGGIDAIRWLTQNVFVFSPSPSLSFLIRSTSTLSMPSRHRQIKQEKGTPANINDCFLTTWARLLVSRLAWYWAADMRGFPLLLRSLCVTRRRRRRSEEDLVSSCLLMKTWSERASERDWSDDAN